MKRIRGAEIGVATAAVTTEVSAENAGGEPS